KDSVDLLCLTLESTSRRQQGTLSDLVQAAMYGHREQIKGALGRKAADPDLRFKFRSVRINEAISSQAAYNQTVRLLYQADVAVLDVTNYEPGVMLFLG